MQFEDGIVAPQSDLVHDALNLEELSLGSFGARSPPLYSFEQPDTTLERVLKHSTLFLNNSLKPMLR
jgi:hypothetical protein